MADWITVDVSAEPILRPVSPIIESLDSILSFLIATLNVVQAILQVLKVFLVGNLDPIRAVVELALSEIQNLILDLRQLGIYLTGDWVLLTSEDKFSYLVGGYQSYERRMIGRLQDRSDPNRPNFTSSTTVVGAFFYASSEDINELARILRAFLVFFGQGDLAGKSSPYGRPLISDLQYGTEGASTAAFRNLAQTTASPTAFSVSWEMPAGAGGIGQLFNPAPKGFLIHVSTIPDGFNVLSLTPNDTASADTETLPKVYSAAVDPTTNGPLKLYGGLADLGVDVDSRNFSTVESADPRAVNLVLQIDQNTPLIRPSLLQPLTATASSTGGAASATVDEIPLLATTFFVRTDFLSRTGPGSKYTATFPRSALPLRASLRTGSDGFAEIEGTPEPSETYYVRVRALTEDYIDALAELDGTLTNPASVYPSNVRLFRFSPGRLREAINGVLLPEPPGIEGGNTLTSSSYTAASSSRNAEFPSSIQSEYIRAIQSAIALVVLVRADLTEAAIDATTGFPIFSRGVYAPGGATGLEGAGRDLLARYGISPVWFRGLRPQQFRLKMRWLMARIASDLQARGAPPETVAEFVVEEAAELLAFRWNNLHFNYPNQTILESFEDGAEENKGIGSNPFCRTLAKKNIQALYNSPAKASLRSRFPDVVIPNRAPGFLWVVGPDQDPSDEELMPTVWVPGDGSADFSPIIFNDGTFRVEYVRNAFLRQPDLADEVFGSAIAVLQLATAPLSRPIGDTQWIAIRLMPQAFGPLDELLGRVDRFLQGVLDGQEGIIDKIVKYIEAIQARIYQLQALLEQIRALLRSMDFFVLPSVSGLVLVESGTDGLTRGLVSAENKPFDSSTSYGAGLAIVSGGVPSLLQELLLAILGNGDE